MRLRVIANSILDQSIHAGDMTDRNGTAVIETEETDEAGLSG